MTAWLFLASAWLVGVAVVRRALGRVLTRAERALWGLVVGWVMATAAGYACARASGRLTTGLMLALTVALCAAALLLWLPELRRAWRVGLTRPRLALSTDEKYLALLLALFAPAYLRLFWTHMLMPGADGGLYTGGSAWYDLGLHTSLSTSFLYAHNFPPVYTVFPPEPLLYPFLPDFQTALLASLGMSLRAALIASAVPLALALTGLCYTFALRVLRTVGGDEDEGPGDEPMRPAADTARAATDTKRAATDTARAAALSAVLFLLNGGLGFVYFFHDWRESGKGLAEFWSALDTNYANMGERTVVWTNIIADTLLPQRASLFGVPLALMIFTLFAVAWCGRPEHDGEAARPWDDWRVLACAGVLAGALPLFHAHSYGAVGLASGFLFLLRPRRAWLAFWLPAVALPLPHFAGLAGHIADNSFVRLQAGWRVPAGASWTLFWLKNVGLPLVLVIPAWLSAPSPLRRFYLAFAGLFLFALLVVVSPNDYDNIKLLFYWYAATCVLIARWLVRLAKTRARRAAALALALLSVATGLLALRSEDLSRRRLFTRAEVSAADFAREHTHARSLFLTAPTVHQPVLSLAGRAVLRGDTAWTWSHGYPFAERERDVRAIYRGSDDALELLDYYRIDYVYLGDRELHGLRADADFFERNFPAAFRGDGVTIYDARRGRADRREFAAYPPREFSARVERDPYQLLVEFPRASFAVYRLYRVALGRWPRRDEFMADMREVGRGVYVGADGWRQRLEENKRALAEGWPARDEFKAKHDAETDEAFVAALYANAQVSSTPHERERLAAALRDGRETRGTAALVVAESDELYRREYNTAYLLMHYFGYLGRGPDDPPDKDLSGFNFWLEILDRTNDYRSATRVFIESGEYKDREKP